MFDIGTAIQSAGRHTAHNVYVVWQALLVHKGKHFQQLLTIKRAKVNAAQVLTFPVALKGVVKCDGSNRVDVNVVEEGIARHIIARSAAVL